MIFIFLVAAFACIQFVLFERILFPLICCHQNAVVVIPRKKGLMHSGNDALEEAEDSSCLVVDVRAGSVEITCGAKIDGCSSASQKVAHVDNDREMEEKEESEEDEDSYQESSRFRTWRKHILYLYQELVHIDLVWESPPVQLMPYMSLSKDSIASQTMLTGTRTGGKEQNYLQFVTVMLPTDASSLDGVDGGGFCDVTGEIGGFGRAPAACGMRVERRMYHDGDVLAARYMHANPLLIGTASSNGSLYVFDWSRISLQQPPNKPERPRGPLPPNSLTENPTDEERAQYHKRMKQINDVQEQQEAWDQQRGAGQHVLTLTGLPAASNHLDWNTTTEGLLVSGSESSVAVWQIGTVSKADDRTVKPCWTARLEEGASVSDCKFAWNAPTSFVSGLADGSVLHFDTRSDGGATALFELDGTGVTQVAWSPLDANSIAVGTCRGTVALFDLRSAATPTETLELHSGGEVSCLQWCPHRRGLLASGGDDGIVALFDAAGFCEETVGEQLDPRIVFKHAGHTDAVSDLCWNWQDAFAFQLASVDRNAVTVWRPRNRFLE